MDRFPHLKFSEKVVGRARFGRSGSSKQSEQNRNNRKQHSQTLGQNTSNIKNSWEESIAQRESLGLAPINSEVQPLYMQISPSLLGDLQFDLENLGIEIISQEDEGFIIGASLDNLRTLEEKIAGFENKEHGTGGIADLYKIIDGNPESWKPESILSPELFSKWNEIQDEQEFHLEVSIAFDKPIKVTLNPDSRLYESQLRKKRRLEIERDNRLSERESNFEEFISHYNGELTSGFVHLADSFGCSVKLSGKGLKDLVVNYQFVFEVVEVEEIESLIGSIEEEPNVEFETIVPENGAPEIGVIDSGIQEEHKYIDKAIIPENSKSYLDDDTSTADKVANGGHGTMVAGALLYPNGIAGETSPYQLPCFIRNLRVLDKDKKLQTKLPADLITQIVEENPDCQIFNHSINSTVPFRLKHMSLWAATMDTLSYQKNILFVNSVGNLLGSTVRHYLQNGVDYPNYLQNPECRIANPAQSSFSLVVGSINHIEFDEQDWATIGGKDEVSSFSRIGTGIWGMIKPDVVEYGGALKVSKNGLNQVTNNNTSIEHLRSTFHGGSAHGSDSVGTSLSTPKVTHIVAQLKKLYPEDNVNLLRALVAQGVRLPLGYFQTPSKQSLQYYGYGLPSLDRVTKNTEHRITFYNTNVIRAEEGQIYTLKIPEALSAQGDEYDILIEVSLAYTANVRRTRQKTKSYLSTWLERECSKLGEDSNIFKDRVLKVVDGEVIEEYENTDGILPWKLRTRGNWGEVEEIHRNNSTLQKDWAIIKSYELPKELSFAAIAHKGWDSQREPVPYALTVSIEILGADIPIYESIKIENEVEIESLL